MLYHDALYVMLSCYIMLRDTILFHITRGAELLHNFFVEFSPFDRFAVCYCSFAPQQIFVFSFFDFSPFYRFAACYCSFAPSQSTQARRTNKIMKVSRLVPTLGGTNLDAFFLYIMKVS